MFDYISGADDEIDEFDEDNEAGESSHNLNVAEFGGDLDDE